VSNKVRLAFIGAGGISHAHAQGVLAHPDKVECVALCDVSESSLATRAAQFGGKPALFRDWKEMLAAKAPEIDAVDICLPHHLHAPAILDAAQAGKHILCEKPMCINLDEADRLVDAVKQAGIVYMSAHNQIFTPSMQEARKMIGAGMIGQVRCIRSQDCFSVPRDGVKGKWRSSLKFQGGGVLIDTGYHPTYRLLYLAQAEVAAVRGTMGRFQLELEGEDSASVQVRFTNGIVGEVFTSWAFSRPYGTHDIHVIGDRGELFGGGSNVFYHLPLGFKTPSEKILPEVDTFAAQMGRFADCILNGTRPPHGVEEGREVLRIILKAAESAEGWQKTAQLQLP
jgi:predicted dehydrogenase